MDIEMLTLGTRVRTECNGPGTVIGRRIGGCVEGLLDEGALIGENAVTVWIAHLGVPPETIRLTCRPSSILEILS